MKEKVSWLRVLLHYFLLEVVHCDQALMIRGEAMDTKVLYLPELGTTYSEPNDHKEQVCYNQSQF
jgi:hypothetical protein